MNIALVLTQGGRRVRILGPQSRDKILIEDEVWVECIAYTQCYTQRDNFRNIVESKVHTKQKVIFNPEFDSRQGRRRHPQSRRFNRGIHDFERV